MHPVRCFCIASLLTVLVAPLASAQSSTATGVSNKFNPAISVNGLLLGRVADQSTDSSVNGIDLQEAEVRFTSIVDPYWKANLTFAIHPEHDHEHEEEGGDSHGGYAGDLEQAYVDGTALPGGWALRLGKDYLPYGKHVPLHTHEYAFVDAPVAVSTFLGDHSLSEVGVRAAHALPVPWYMDLSAYAVDGASEIFDGSSRDLAFGARLENIVDLSDNSTLEISGSWLYGPLSPTYLMLHEDEDPLKGDLSIYGADVTYKWVSASSSQGPAFNLTGEVVIPRPEEGAGSPLGWYAIAQYRFARTWWLGLGAGWLDRDLPAEEDEADEEHGHEGFGQWEEVAEYKANLTWVPSEFSAVRLEAARYDDMVGDQDDWLYSLQVNFTIGSHPAHRY